MKLYSALYHGEGFPFDALTDETVVVRTPEELTDINSILVVWGGQDISPDLYKHPWSRTTHAGGRRDTDEWALMQAAVKLGIPIIGVCRGAQMLCALAGGCLIQDVRGHLGSHLVVTSEGDTIQVNSIHHQMMEPSMTDHELLAWVKSNRSYAQEGSGWVPHYLWKDDQEWTPPKDFLEPEFVYFPKVKGFAIQWHPEGMGRNSPANQYVLETIKEKLCLNMTVE